MVLADFVKESKTVNEFHERFTIKWLGYPTTSAYYAKMSSHESIKDLRVPTIFVNSKNDPISL